MNEVYYKDRRGPGSLAMAIKIRDKAFDELAVYVSNLRAITKVALSDSPQQLETLGILARSGKATPQSRLTLWNRDSDYFFHANRPYLARLRA